MKMRIDKIFRIDGECIPVEEIEKFNLRSYSRNIRFSRYFNEEVLDFVGFIVKEDKILISLPKHYVSNSRMETLGNDDIHLLFQVLIAEQIKNADNYTGSIKDFESNFPFKAYYDIQQYFKQYGLYTEKRIITKPGYNGKISWKDTIRKATNIISSGSIIYIPFFVKESQNQEVFISQCMAFAINYTLDKFPFFVKESQYIKNSVNNFDFWTHREYVINRLRKIYSNVFKDVEKKLIKSLIEFYLNVPEGGNITIKHYNFELVWESIVEKYLNDNFFRLDSTKGIVFGENRNINFKKKKFYIDKIHKNNFIEPDHYYKDQKRQFIFDSKYFSDAPKLNYKQAAYQNFLSEDSLETSSVLILPTEDKNISKIHFELKEEYNSCKEGTLRIWECYLNVRQAMENYVK